MPNAGKSKKAKSSVANKKVRVAAKVLESIQSRNGLDRKEKRQSKLDTIESDDGLKTLTSLGGLQAHQPGSD